MPSRPLNRNLGCGSGDETPTTTGLHRTGATRVLSGVPFVALDMLVYTVGSLAKRPMTRTRIRTELPRDRLTARSCL